MPEYKSLRNMTDAEVVDRVKSDFKDAETEKQRHWKRYKRYAAMYEAQDPPEMMIDSSTGKMEDEEGRYANSYMAVGAAVVDSAVRLLYNTLFSTYNYFAIKAERWEDEPFEFRITAHLQKRMREMAFRQTIAMALQTCAIYDYAVTGTRWLCRPGYEPRLRRTDKLMNLAGTSVRYRDSKMEYVWVPDAIDRCDLFVFDFLRCYHDPTAGPLGFSDSRFFIDTRDESIEELLLQAKTKDQPWGRYKNVDKVVQQVIIANKATLSPLNEADRIQWVNSRRVEICRYWTGDHIAEVCQNEVINRTNASGWVLQKWSMYDVPGTFKSMGLLQRLERNQYDINASMNSRRNFQNLVSDPFGVMDEELQGRDGTSQLYPGKMMISSGGDVREKLMIYSPGANTNQESFADLQAHMSVIERVSQLGENAQSSYSSGRKTAREVSAVQAATSSGVLAKAKMIEEVDLCPIYEQFFKLEQTFLRKEERFKYMGPDGEQWTMIRPEDYKWNALPTFHAQGAIFAEQDAVKIQQTMTLLEMALKIPQVAGPDEIRALYLKLAQMLDPKDYFRYAKDPRITVQSIPPQEEEFLAMSGWEIHRSEGDDDRQHLAAHKRFLASAEFKVLPGLYQNRMLMHLKEHTDALSGPPPTAQTVQPTQPEQPGQTPGTQDASDPLRGIRGEPMESVA